MKSGTIINLDRVKHYNFEYRGNEITSLKIEYYKYFKPSFMLHIKTLDLSQIEAICEKRLFRW